jgi:hypothetical protein
MEPKEAASLIASLSAAQRKALRHCVDGTEPLLATRSHHGGYTGTVRSLQAKGLVAYSPRGFCGTPLGRFVLDRLPAR